MDNRMDTPETVQRPMRREQAHGGTESIGQTMRVIEAMEHKLSDAYRVPLRKNMIMVDMSEMIDLIGQLRIALPKSVQQAQAVLASSQKIIDDAKARADKTADDADKIYNDTVTKARAFKDEIEAEAEAYDKETRRRAQEDADAIVADAQTRAEQLIFSAGDKDKIGQTVVDAANAKGGLSLTVADATRPLNGGFVLSSGAVEVNCSFETLMRLQRSEITGEVSGVLFQ